MTINAGLTRNKKSCQPCKINSTCSLRIDSIFSEEMFHLRGIATSFLLHRCRLLTSRHIFLPHLLLDVAKKIKFFSSTLFVSGRNLSFFLTLGCVSVASWEIETFHYRYHLEVKICSWDGDAKVGRRNGAATIIIYLPSFTSFSYLFIPYDDHFVVSAAIFLHFLFLGSYAMISRWFFSILIRGQEIHFERFKFYSNLSIKLPNSGRKKIIWSLLI